MDFILKIISIAMAAVIVYLGMSGIIPAVVMIYLLGISISVFIFAIALKDKFNDKEGKHYSDNVNL